MIRPAFPATPSELEQYPAIAAALDRIRPVIDAFAASTDHRITSTKPL